MSAFYHSRHIAEPSGYKLWANTPEAIEARLDRLLASIKINAVVVPAPNSSSGRPALVSFSSVRRLISRPCKHRLIKRRTFYGPLTGNPVHPMLFIANSADNVMALSGARLIAGGFNGSRIEKSANKRTLAHESLSSPKMQAAVVKAYLQHGTLLKNEFFCKADVVPFDSVEVGSQRLDDGDFALVV